MLNFVQITDLRQGMAIDGYKDDQQRLLAHQVLKDQDFTFGVQNHPASSTMLVILLGSSSYI